METLPKEALLLRDLLAIQSCHWLLGWLSTVSPALFLCVFLDSEPALSSGSSKVAMQVLGVTSHSPCQREFLTEEWRKLPAKHSLHLTSLSWARCLGPKQPLQDGQVSQGSELWHARWPPGESGKLEWVCCFRWGFRELVYESHRWCKYYCLAQYKTFSHASPHLLPGGAVTCPWGTVAEKNMRDLPGRRKCKRTQY